MPRFSDEWVIDRTMFEFVNGGSCACCGFTHLFHPDGIKGLIDACTDLETDAANAEFDAIQSSPWPPQMRTQVWADRVRLRTKMKMEMRNEFQPFLQQYNRDDIQFYCRSILGRKGLKLVFQMPRKEIAESLNGQYNIHSAFAVVLCAVAEQVAHFHDTKYDTDGRGYEEIQFEYWLSYDKRGGYVLPVQEDDEAFEALLEMFLNYMFTLGGPKLLARSPKREGTGGSDDEDDDDDEEEGDADDALPQKKKKTPVVKAAGPSFRSDRRLIRLLIGRYWARSIMTKYREYHDGQQEKQGDDEADVEVGGDVSDNTEAAAEEGQSSSSSSPPQSAAAVVAVAESSSEGEEKKS